jgi:hypothetical protein
MNHPPGRRKLIARELLEENTRPGRSFRHAHGVDAEKPEEEGDGAAPQA